MERHLTPHARIMSSQPGHFPVNSPDVSPKPSCFLWHAYTSGRQNIWPTTENVQAPLTPQSLLTNRCELALSCAGET